MRSHVHIRSLLFLVLLLPSGLGAAPPQSGKDASPVTFRDGRMAALVEELTAASPTAARMLAELRAANMTVVFGTPETLLDEVRREYRGYDPSRARALGFMAPRIRRAAEGGLTTEGVFVVLDLQRLDHLFGRARDLPRPAGMSWSSIQRLETLALLGHELVHAWGLLRSGGDPRNGCLDPADGEPTRTSCVVLAENIIRLEMEAPLDWGYGLSPLALLPDLYRRHVRRKEVLKAMSRDAARVLRERHPASSAFGIGTPPLLSPLSAPDLGEAPER